MAKIRNPDGIIEPGEKMKKPVEYQRALMLRIG